MFYTPQCFDFQRKRKPARIRVETDRTARTVALCEDAVYNHGDMEAFATLKELKQRAM